MGGSGVNGEQDEEKIGPDGMTDSVRALTQKNAWEAIKNSDGYSGFLGTTPSLSKDNASNISLYSAWKTKQDEANKDHQTYLDAVKKNPGRQGTILVPASNTNDPTILTGGSKKPKTVLS